MSEKYDIIINKSDGSTIYEFQMSEECVENIVTFTREQMKSGGHEVPFEDIMGVVTEDQELIKDLADAYYKAMTSADDTFAPGQDDLLIRAKWKL